jgi:hypothetical protein
MISQAEGRKKHVKTVPSLQGQREVKKETFEN